MVRWEKPAAASPTTITYSFARSFLDTPAARNCGQIVPMDSLLERSAISPKRFRQETQAAFAMWQHVANLRFVEVDGDADIVIGAQAVPRGRAFTNVEPHAGTTGNKQLQAIDRALICLNPAQKWKVGFDGDLNVYDLRYTLAHEIGHAIGLDHPEEMGQLMSFRYAESFREPQTGDIRGMVALYGPPRNSGPALGRRPREQNVIALPVSGDAGKALLGIE